MKIAVVGAGYVGLSLATLLSEKNKVDVLDISEEKIKMINNRISYLNDAEIDSFFKNKTLNLNATMNAEEAFTDARYIIIATPTNYNENFNSFDTQSIEDVIEKIIKLNPKATIIIKSTVPIGYTDKMKEKYNINNLIFSPEFLREGKALYDNLYPSRIIVGEKSDRALEFGNLLKDSSLKKDIEIKLMNSKEAESVKLFSNAYLAMRIAFFNELDSFAEINNLNTKDIIKGVCLDSRIGNYYNNPSFGYGGYCLPKDSKQLLHEYKDIPQKMITAIVDSNEKRKNHIASVISNKRERVIGIYRLNMKYESDNYRESAIVDIINKIENKKIIIYETLLKDGTFENYEIINNLEHFIKASDLIIANRVDDNLEKVKNKVYTRDIFHRD